MFFFAKQKQDWTQTEELCYYFEHIKTHQNTQIWGKHTVIFF